MADPFDLDRFVEAQDPVFDRVVAELRAGEKATHWMWFVFPQLRGLGHSAMAMRYGIAGTAEGTAYLAHPILGARLEEVTQLVLDVHEKRIEQVFPHPDDLKFYSCMTLFAGIAPAGSVFEQALGRFYGGVGDPATLARLH